ncbi:hypothetical protein MAR_026164 [Mya arenaria]|uniref:Transposase domain-containing protein n=1 Tax=Mya arenaria TaxID=6604 RepID=A0ABY7ES79_MYAAR|nr:hypothetical protein MAR_026164 [Mya arenaria]
MDDVISAAAQTVKVPFETVQSQIPVSQKETINVKSTNCQFWPILARTVHTVVSKPFAVGIFLGNEKPDNASDYLRDLVDDINNLTVTGLQLPQTGHHIQIEISCVLCDTPARPLVKQSKGHSGYFGCDKCSQKGLYVNHRMTFPDTNALLRTDVQFNEMANEEHHKGRSPFLDTNLGLVTQFPIDYMHLVCLWVMKRLLCLWTKGATRLPGPAFTMRVCHQLVGLSAYMPREFLRKELERWKATEFRTFLLYTGLVVKEFCPRNYINILGYYLLPYIAFQALFFCQPYREFANQLLVSFVSLFRHHYGKDQYVYNMHGLVHLANDVSRFGELDGYSCFPFESYLGRLKKPVRKPNYPLQQVIRRLSEKSVEDAKLEPKLPKSGVVKKRHHNGPRLNEYVVYGQFEEISLPKYFLSVQQGNICILVGDKVGLVRNILSPSEEATERIFVVQWYSGVLGCFYIEPFHSSDLKVFRVSRLHEDTAAVSLKDITCKCVLLPYKNDFVVVPPIHSFKIKNTALLTMCINT